MPADLSLTLVKGLPKTRPETRTVTTEEYRLGRGEADKGDVDWVLPDAALTLSRLHCVLSRDRDDWFITDVSRNGTFINQERNPIAARVPRPLQTGDRIRIGDYEFQVELAMARRPSLIPQPPLPPPLPPQKDELAPWPPESEGRPMPKSSLFDRLLEGAKLSALDTPDPAQTMLQIGEVLSAIVSGLRRIEAARRSIRAGFRIRDTGNPENPLLSASSDREALEALLVPDAASMPAATAVDEVLTEIGRHELATITAMRSAIRALLRALSPDAVQNQAAQNSGGLKVLATQRKARAWDEYEAQYAQIQDALENDFDRVFGKTFAEAYDRAHQAGADRAWPR